MIFCKSPISPDAVELWAGGVNKNQNGSYDWHGHQEVIKRMAFQLTEDVHNGTRDSITFENVDKPTSYELALVEKIEENR